MMGIWRGVLYGLAGWMLLIGLWDHDWHLIVGGVVVFLIFPLISSDVDPA